MHAPACIDQRKPKEVDFLKKFLNHPAVVFVRDAVLLYFSRRVPQAAAALAYFMLLSVFPVLICVSSVLGLLDINVASMIGELQVFLPEDALQLIEGYLSYISRYRSPGFFIAGFLAGWFSSAAAFRTIARVIIDMYDEVSHSFLRGMVSSILFPVALLVTVDLSAVVVVASQKTLKILTGHFDLGGNDIHIFNLLRYVLIFALFLLFIWAVLKLPPQRERPSCPFWSAALFLRWLWWFLRRSFPGSSVCPPAIPWSMARWFR